MSHGAVDSTGLLGLVSRELTPDLVHRAALQLGENEDRTRSALSASIPSVLTTLSDVASSHDGAQHLSHVIHRVDSRGPARSVASRFGSSAGREEGVVLFDAEAGDRAGPLADAVARTTGVNADSAHKLLGGATGAALLALGRNFGKLGPEALQSLLSRQRGEFVRNLPGPIASLFNGHSKSAQPAALPPTSEGNEDRYVTGPAIRELPRPQRGGWILPVLLLAALALIAIPLLRGFHRPTQALPPAPRAVPTATAQPPESVLLPNGTALAVARGSSADSLARFMAGSQPTPERFTLAPLSFGFASAQLTPESLPTVNEVAAILIAYPTATITVESHTDNVGAENANLELSQSRSSTVREMLIERGVDGARVQTAGLGQGSPFASNDTAEGRAKNRRTDIIVTGR
jgi:outer membrane protein OmpA-like peptidoglycan-associated protein